MNDLLILLAIVTFCIILYALLEWCEKHLPPPTLDNLTLCHLMKAACPYSDYEGKKYWDMYTEKMLVRGGGNYNLDRKLSFRRFYIMDRWREVKKEVVAEYYADQKQG